MVITNKGCLSQDCALAVLHLVSKQTPDWKVIKYNECRSLECAHDVLMPKQQPCAFMCQHVSGYFQLSLNVLFLTKMMIIMMLHFHCRVAIFLKSRYEHFNLAADNFNFFVNEQSL